jgi:hypothetical protein
MVRSLVDVVGMGEGGSFFEGEDMVRSVSYLTGGSGNANLGKGYYSNSSADSSSMVWRLDLDFG